MTQGNRAYLVNAPSNMPSEGFATRSGFLQSTNNTSVAAGTPISLRGVGHIFGLLGQGEDTMPGNT
jgi:hypothetical protein